LSGTSENIRKVAKMMGKRWMMGCQSAKMAFRSEKAGELPTGTCPVALV